MTKQLYRGQRRNHYITFLSFALSLYISFKINVKGVKGKHSQEEFALLQLFSAWRSPKDHEKTFHEYTKACVEFINCGLLLLVPDGFLH